MKDNTSRLRPGVLGKALWWIASWLLLVGLSLDFYNWGRMPRLWLGLPCWLWAEVGIILLVSAVYGLLARFTWNEEEGSELASGRRIGGTNAGSAYVPQGKRRSKGARTGVGGE